MGLEFLAHFRGDKQTPPAQVIIVTTEGREDDYKRGLESRASAYLKKPFNSWSLTEPSSGADFAPVQDQGRHVSEGERTGSGEESKEHSKARSH